MLEDDVTMAKPKRSPKKKKILEKDIQREICDWLFSKSIFFWRSNNVPVFDKGRMQFRSLPKYTPKGLPDIMILHAGMFIGLEVKVPNYWKRPDSQMEMDEKITQAGGFYFVVTSLVDAQNVLAKIIVRSFNY